MCDVRAGCPVRSQGKLNAHILRWIRVGRATDCAVRTRCKGATIGPILQVDAQLQRYSAIVLRAVIGWVCISDVACRCKQTPVSRARSVIVLRIVPPAPRNAVSVLRVVQSINYTVKAFTAVLYNVVVGVTSIGYIQYRVAGGKCDAAHSMSSLRTSKPSLAGARHAEVVSSLKTSPVQLNVEHRTVCRPIRHCLRRLSVYAADARAYAEIRPYTSPLCSTTIYPLQYPAQRRGTMPHGIAMAPQVRNSKP